MPVEQIRFNPFNNRLYFTYDTRPIHINSLPSPSIYSMNLDDGSYQLEFTIGPSEFDHPQHPAIYPFDFAFTENGKGIILLRKDGVTGFEWKLVDCEDNHTIYWHENYEHIFNPYEFEKITTNKDQTKFIASKSAPVTFFIDQDSEAISELIHPVYGSVVEIALHKKEDDYLIRQLYEQYIMDEDGITSEVSYLDSRHAGGFDFCYNEGYENYAFYWEANSFVDKPAHLYIVDHNTGEYKLVSYKPLPIQKLMATKNGKHLITLTDNYPYHLIFVDPNNILDGID